MPAHPTTDDQKRAAGTFRADRAGRGTGLAVALARWPSAPRGFTDDERRCWKALGKVLLPCGTVAAGDLVLCSTLARVMARLDACFLDPALKVSTLSSLARLQTDLLRQLGATPAARRSVGSLPSAPDEEDPVEEFARG